MFLRPKKTNRRQFVFLFAGLILYGCGSFINKDKEQEPLARVGENYLYESDIKSILYDGITRADSASIVTNYINNWAAKRLMLSKAKVNLSEEKLREFEVLVSDYQTDLYTRAYKDALINQGADTIVSKSQMRSFYEAEKTNFRLKEKLVKIRFIQLPNRFLNKQTVIQKMKSFDAEDRKFLDSIGVQFKKLNFNDSIWVRASRVIDEIPPLNAENQNKYLKKTQFFELKDAFGVYLAKVLDVRNANDVAPLSFIEPTIKQVLLNRRKLDYMRKLEIEIIDEAVKENEFEIYAKEE